MSESLADAIYIDKPCLLEAKIKNDEDEHGNMANFKASDIKSTLARLSLSELESIYYLLQDSLECAGFPYLTFTVDNVHVLEEGETEWGNKSN